jgi:hypothetical protein
MRPEPLREHRRGEILRRRLAVRAGDRDDVDLRSPSSLVRCQVEQRSAGVRDNDRGLACRPSLDERGDGAVRERLLDEGVTVDALAAEGDEQRTVRDEPAVGRDRPDADIPAEQPATDRRRDVRERARDQLGTSRSASSSSAATTRSSNAIVRSASSWYGSWPFPAITTTSPARARETADRIAVRRSGSIS